MPKSETGKKSRFSFQGLTDASYSMFCAYSAKIINHVWSLIFHMSLCYHLEFPIGDYQNLNQIFMFHVDGHEVF